MRELLNFLTVAGQCFALARDEDAAYDLLTRLAIPFLCELCVVDVLTPQGIVRRAVVGDPARYPEMLAASMRTAPPPDGRHGVAEVIRTGMPHLYSGENYRHFLAGDDVFASFAAEDFAYAVMVPISAGGPPLGVASFLSRGAISIDESSYLSVCEQHTRFAAVAIENTRVCDRERLARREAEDAQQRLAFKARVSSLFSRSLHSEATMKRLAKLFTVSICDTAEIYLVDEKTGDLRPAATASATLEVSTIIQTLRRRYPPSLRDAEGLGNVARIGRPQLFRENIYDTGGRLSNLPERDLLYEQWAPHSSIGAPFFSDGRLAGIICVYRDRSRQALEFDDLSITQDVGRRLANYLETARNFERERTIASALQTSFLPQTMPPVDGLRFAVRYLAGGTGLDVGGDWYDVIDVGRGRTVVTMGDVVGRGVSAAAIMGQLRHVLHAYAVDGASPATALERLNQLLLRSDDGKYATVFYGVIDRDAGTLSYARAGHPPPVLIDPAGCARLLDAQGNLPIGVWAEAAFDESTCAFTAGSSLVLYTDGLVETRERAMQQGIEHMLKHLQKATAEPEDLADELLREFAPDRSDDTAVLIVRHQNAEDRLHHRWFLAHVDARCAARLRAEIIEYLLQFTPDNEYLFEASLAIGEVLGNVARHAGGEADIVLDWRGEYPVLQVADRGPGIGGGHARGLHSDILRENGRGLELIRLHVRSFEVSEREGGGTVAEMQLNLERIPGSLREPDRSLAR